MISSSDVAAGIGKSPTGIPGLDEITGGGLPTGRPTLICGSAGCGKTLLSMEFLVRGIVEQGEPGLFVAFEENASELAANVRSLGFDLEQLEADGKLMIDHVHIEQGSIEENGEYDLEGLFIRLNYQIDAIGAKRVVLDTIETLFAGLGDHVTLRGELVRLFRWLKDKGVTAVITGERGDGTLTRHGLEEYVSDCVILLDHRVNEQISTRRLRVVKYRGTAHGTNEYPFLIDRSGFSVMPITSMDLRHDTSDECLSTGNARLDYMLGGRGFYRGSSVLISGTAGTGKSSILSSVVDAACQRGEKAVYFAFEESPAQIVRNMSKIGVNLQRWVESGQLAFHAARPQLHGLEMHLVAMHRLVEEFGPSVVVVDPISNLANAGTQTEASLTLVRLVDFLKHKGVTSLFSSLTHGGNAVEATDYGISSLMDSWLLLRNIEYNGERNRGLYVLKSRGMNHSNQVREFVITSNGIDLLDVYVGPDGVLTGSARLAQQARDEERERERAFAVDSKRRELERKRRVLEAQIEALKAEFEAEQLEAEQLGVYSDQEIAAKSKLRDDLASARRADNGN
jgi:circadian clock protein KaiC